MSLQQDPSGQCLGRGGEGKFPDWIPTQRALELLGDH